MAALSLWFQNIPEILLYLKRTLAYYNYTLLYDSNMHYRISWAYLKMLRYSNYYNILA